MGLVAAGSVPTGRYRLVANRSQLAIELYKAGLLRAFADNHLIIAGEIEGSAQGFPDSWSGLITVPVAKLKVADPGRSAKDRQTIWATMEGPQQLDAARFPLVVWRLNAITPTTGAPGYLLRGTFALHGVTRPVAWPTHLASAGDEARVWGAATLKLSDFGIRPVRRALGTVRVRDQFQLRWDTFWQRR
ncbi:MAG: YceI family protein [Terriglobales bacterium]